MEVVPIEKQLFEAMMARFVACTEQVDALLRANDEQRMSQWLDNQDVCLMLGVTLRTLQSYREQGTLAYAQIGRKIFYRPEDVQSVLLKQSTPPHPSKIQQ